MAAGVPDKRTRHHVKGACRVSQLVVPAGGANSPIRKADQREFLAMSRILQAIYDGKFPGSTFHLDDGTGKPLCYRLGIRDNSAISWVLITATEPSCKLCMARQRSIQRANGWGPRR